MSNNFEECKDKLPVDKHKFWQSHIESWEHSGSTQSAYCRNNGLSSKLFGYWKRKLCSKGEAAVSFVPVSIKKPYPASVNAGTSLRLVVGNG